MDTATFNARYDQIVSPAFTTRNGRQVGRRLFVEIGPWSITLLQTNLRNVPPPEFTLCIRHREMRDFDNHVGGEPPTSVNEYPLKLVPSDLPRMLTPAWRYQPLNLGHYPKEEFSLSVGDDALVDRLWSLRGVLDDALPRLAEEFLPTRLLCELETHGEGAWCERRWIEDLRVLHPTHVCPDDGAAI